MASLTYFSVTVASRLHRKLMYTNEHQKCLLQSCKKELECKKFELVALKAALSQKKDSLSSDSDKERSRLDALERELHMVFSLFVGQYSAIFLQLD